MFPFNFSKSKSKGGSTDRKSSRKLVVSSAPPPSFQLNLAAPQSRQPDRERVPARLESNELYDFDEAVPEDPEAVQRLTVERHSSPTRPPAVSPRPLSASHEGPPGRHEPLSSKVKDTRTAQHESSSASVDTPPAPLPPVSDPHRTRKPPSPPPPSSSPPQTVQTPPTHPRHPPAASSTNKAEVPLPEPISSPQKGPDPPPPVSADEPLRPVLDAIALQSVGADAEDEDEMPGGGPETCVTQVIPRGGMAATFRGSRKTAVSMIPPLFVAEGGANEKGKRGEDSPLGEVEKENVSIPNELLQIIVCTWLSVVEVARLSCVSVAGWKLIRLDKWMRKCVMRGGARGHRRRFWMNYCAEVPRLQVAVAAELRWFSRKSSLAEGRERGGAGPSLEGEGEGGGEKKEDERGQHDGGTPRLHQEDEQGVRKLGEDVFEFLASLPLSESREDEIRRDVGRTFPKHPKFREKGGEGQRGLYKILHALVTLDRAVGYCQGMNFLVAGLMLELPSPCEAFWVCLAVLRHFDYLLLFAPGVPLLSCRLFQFSQVIREHLPKLWDHLQRLTLNGDFFAHQWFMTLFAYSVEPPALQLLWDAFFLCGWKALFRAGTALLKAAEGELLQRDMEGILSFVQKMRAERQNFISHRERSGGAGGASSGVGGGQLLSEAEEAATVEAEGLLLLQEMEEVRISNHRLEEAAVQYQIAKFEGLLEALPETLYLKLSVKGEKDKEKEMGALSALQNQSKTWNAGSGSGGGGEPLRGWVSLQPRSLPPISSSSLRSRQGGSLRDRLRGPRGTLLSRASSALAVSADSASERIGREQKQKTHKEKSVAPSRSLHTSSLSPQRPADTRQQPSPHLAKSETAPPKGPSPSPAALMVPPSDSGGDVLPSPQQPNKNNRKERGSGGLRSSLLAALRSPRHALSGPLEGEFEIEEPPEKLLYVDMLSLVVRNRPMEGTPYFDSVRRNRRCVNLSALRKRTMTAAAGTSRLPARRPSLAPAIVSRQSTLRAVNEGCDVSPKSIGEAGGGGEVALVRLPSEVVTADGTRVAFPWDGPPSPETAPDKTRTACPCKDCVTQYINALGEAAGAMFDESGAGSLSASAKGRSGKWKSISPSKMALLLGGRLPEGADPSSLTPVVEQAAAGLEKARTLQIFRSLGVPLPPEVSSVVAFDATPMEHRGPAALVEAVPNLRTGLTRSTSSLGRGASGTFASQPSVEFAHASGSQSQRRADRQQQQQQLRERSRTADNTPLSRLLTEGPGSPSNSPTSVLTRVLQSAADVSSGKDHQEEFALLPNCSAQSFEAAAGRPRNATAPPLSSPGGGGENRQRPRVSFPSFLGGLLSPMQTQQPSDGKSRSRAQKEVGAEREMSEEVEVEVDMGVSTVEEDQRDSLDPQKIPSLSTAAITPVASPEVPQTRPPSSLAARFASLWSGAKSQQAPMQIAEEVDEGGDSFRRSSAPAVYEPETAVAAVVAAAAAAKGGAGDSAVPCSDPQSVTASQPDPALPMPFTSRVGGGPKGRYLVLKLADVADAKQKLAATELQTLGDVRELSAKIASAEKQLKGADREAEVRRRRAASTAFELQEAVDRKHALADTLKVVVHPETSQGDAPGAGGRKQQQERRGGTKGEGKRGEQEVITACLAKVIESEKAVDKYKTAHRDAERRAKEASEHASECREVKDRYIATLHLLVSLREESRREVVASLLEGAQWSRHPPPEAAPPPADSGGDASNGHSPSGKGGTGGTGECGTRGSGAERETPGHSPAELAETGAAQTPNSTSSPVSQSEKGRVSAGQVMRMGGGRRGSRVVQWLAEDFTPIKAPLLVPQILSSLSASLDR
uniref:Rab-GAP TBC domain-containing protein n=1 Tax=Chromera velia CCMP2878 TaxID=1169474 RepID=A0A0G4I0P0_9ALVE|eukprot:Cvel_1626.t1-p1 / transcript=Cvel_1626.t1 / gene=Cvel_1626 / organism=Chromera_velia_CCMP2878 / gene_product=Ecotropic viral integration site 5 protein homolog, putative / transcript_product=Ecotropic viral integration site 5 protein homolog, putative / location=Cvel_scaffold58:53981-63999(-) / protein_length=1827 / sequence_SO=supercontig / SO=protein_coding / is_pseudo=false